MHSRDPRKQSYLTRLTSSHLRSSELRRYVEPPADLRGRSLLDIGCGTSTIAMDHGAAGARFVALDFRFRSIDELRRSSGEYFDRLRTNLHDASLASRHARLRTAFEDDKADARRFFDDCARGPSGVYVAGDLWHLPFADNTFDFVFSIRCLTDYYTDPDIFLEAASEALRVVKRERPVQISPWQDDYLSLTKGLPIGGSLPQQQAVLLLLRSRGIRHRVKSVPETHVQYLQLWKS